MIINYLSKIHKFFLIISSINISLSYIFCFVGLSAWIGYQYFLKTLIRTLLIRIILIYFCFFPSTNDIIHRFSFCLVLRARHIQCFFEWDFNGDEEMILKKVGKPFSTSQNDRSFTHIKSTWKIWKNSLLISLTNNCN